MRRIRQLLALHFSAGASTRAIGRELGIAPSTVREYVARAAAAGIDWPLGADVTDESLMAQGNRVKEYVTNQLDADSIRFLRIGLREPAWTAHPRDARRSTRQSFS
jgi:hypothetical protein